MKRIAGMLVVLVLTACYGGVETDRFADPESTPPPGWGRPPQATEPVVEGDEIDLSTPLAGPLELPIAGYRFVVPKGASILDHIDESPPVDADSGKPAGEPVPHPHYLLISRGKSLAKIDAETGEIFGWDVKAEDLEDFEPLLHPTPGP